MKKDVFDLAFTQAMDSSRVEHAIAAKKRWRAEHENASARIELAIVDEASAMLLSQHEPIHSLGIDREQLRVLLRYVRCGDADRMRRELDELENKETKA